MGKEPYLDKNKLFADFYSSMGYSEEELYKELSEDLMDFTGESDKIKKFNIKKSEIEIIMNAITTCAAYQRTSQKSMMATKANTIIPPEEKTKIRQIFKDSEALIQTRQTHMREVADIAKQIANALGLNGDFAYLIGLLHDIGHTWNGHSGERILSSVARLENCGYIVHNAMGAYITDRENIIDDAFEDILQYNPKAKEREADIREFMRYVIDGVVSHNGEGTIGKIGAEDKTAEMMLTEIRRCFTEKGADRKILPATLEGAIIRYADIIAYTRSDILDGFRLKDINGNKIIKDFDDDYLAIIGTVLAKETNYNTLLNLEFKFLIEMNKLSENAKLLEGEDSLESRIELERTLKEREIIQKKYEEFCKCKAQYAREYIEKIEPKSKRKTKVTKMMQIAFIKDLVANSKGKDYITMSPLMRRTFFALRALNSKKIVPYVKRGFEADELPKATKKLVDVFAKILVDTGIAYDAIPESERKKLGLPPKESAKQQQEISRINNSSDNGFGYEKKILHYYDNLSRERKEEIFINSVDAIREITEHDVAIAVDEETYDGELKETYELTKIMPIRERIGEMNKTTETLTSSDRQKLIEQIIAERLKDIERVVASKMAIEYIGGMTDKTILSVLLDKNIVTTKQIIEGYARPAPENKIKDIQVENLQATFEKFEEMIKPDEGEIISL